MAESIARFFSAGRYTYITSLYLPSKEGGVYIVKGGVYLVKEGVYLLLPLCN